jgi:hypothetical protein
MRAAWNSYWFAPACAEELACIRIVTYCVLFAVYLPLDDRGWTLVSPVFWMPVSAFHFLPGPPRDAAVIGIIQLLWKTSLAASALGLLSRVSMLAAAGLGFFLLGLPDCFGKIHHLDGFPVLLLAILAISPCADALSLDRLLRRSPPPTERSPAYGWPLRLAQTLFLLVFFAAGYSKLRNSGLAWMTAANMRSIWLREMFTHLPPTRLAALLARSNASAQAAAVATVAFELSALPALFFRRFRIVVLVGLFAMQVLIALMLGVYFTPHLAGYALFLPWQHWYRKFRPPVNSPEAQACRIA